MEFEHERIFINLYLGCGDQEDRMLDPNKTFLGIITLQLNLFGKHNI